MEPIPPFLFTEQNFLLGKFSFSIILFFYHFFFSVIAPPFAGSLVVALLLIDLHALGLVLVLEVVLENLAFGPENLALEPEIVLDIARAPVRVPDLQKILQWQVAMGL